MIGYITVGTKDMPKAAAFFDALLADIGASRMMEEENFIVWATSQEQAAFSIAKPFDGNPATVGNGVMVAFAVKSPEQVNALHAKALSLGATDEGAPGPRGDSGFYAGYFRDLDGNKFNFFTMPQ